MRNTGSSMVSRDVNDIIEMIKRHTTKIYSSTELEHLLKKLAYYDNRHDDVSHDHISGVKHYVDQKRPEV